MELKVEIFGVVEIESVYCSFGVAVNF